MIAVDTNVFIDALDADEPIKQAKAQQLLAQLCRGSGSAVLPWQVAGEILNNLRRSEAAGRVTAAEVESHLRTFLAMFPLVVPSARTFTTYFALHARFSLSHWDAMLLAACREAGVTTLYSEDLAAGTNYDGLTVVNPFV
ncbi:MAG: PIN domain-containing protein [Gemmataceae bacterium]|nr:PIN domain-containing protein [Gemmataceae bacterium]